MSKKIKVTSETESGLNQTFFDPVTNQTMTRGEFVREIKNGNYPDYHVMKRNGQNIPRSNPDVKESNNLG